MSLPLAIRLLAVALCCAFAALPAAAQIDDFTVVVLPDTQHYSRSYPHIFTAQTEWIARNAAAQNIQLVLGVGDLVDDGSSAAQWQNADAAIRVLDRAGIPYVLAIGNHDYDQKKPSSRSAAMFNAFFGPARYAHTPHYGGSFPAGSNENFYSTFRIAGRDYLVLALEFIPRDAALQWASGVIAAHPEKDVIITTHSHLFSDDSHVAKCDPDSAATYGLQADNNGDQVWQKLARQHSNIVMVLSGHIKVGDGTGRLAEIGVNGNLVNQVLADYQHYPQGGSGYLRIMRFRPSLNRIEVSTYSPYLDAWLTDPENQFALKYRNDSLGASGVGFLTGRVRTPGCAKLAGVRVGVGTASAHTDNEGLYRLPVAGPRSDVAAAEHPAFHSTSAMVTVHAGYDAAQDFWMSGASPVGALRTRVLSARGAPLAGARVSISGGDPATARAGITDVAGEFAASTLPTGSYRVAVTIGNTTRAQDVSVSASSTSSVDFYWSTKHTSAARPRPGSFLGRIAAGKSGSMMGPSGGRDESPSAPADRRRVPQRRRPGTR